MSRLNLRRGPRISYYELDEPSLDEYIFCEQCADFVYEYCSIHGPLLVIPDDKVPQNSNFPSFVPRAALTIPKVFLHLAPSVIPGAGLGVFTTLTLPSNVRFGPYEGKNTTEISSMYCWQIYDSDNKPSHAVDGADPGSSNWMRYVNCARHCREQNLLAFQYQGQLYYRTIKIIPRFTELLVFYGSEFANSLHVDLRKYNSPSEHPQSISASILKISNRDLPLENIDNNSQNKLYFNQNENIPNIEQTGTDRLIVRNRSKVNAEENNNLQNICKEKFICNESDKEFDTKDSIIIHSKTKHTKVFYFRCKKCEYFTVANEILYTNSKLHDENRQYACQNCDFRFDKCNILRCHENICFRKSRRTGKLHTCSECEKQFTNKNHLVRHERKHTGERPYLCSECEKRFSSKSDLVRHLRTHTGARPYPCSDCGKQFTDSSRLVRHKRMHTGERPYPCLECGKRFVDRSQLVRHKRMHTGEKPYPCLECGKRFVDRSQLVRHKRMHTGEKPYPCLECGKRFFDRSQLVRHKRMHTGEKPYPCTECKKLFTTKNNLKNHMRLHTGEKPFKCSKCDKLFTNRSSMNKHVKTIH